MTRENVIDQFIQEIGLTELSGVETSVENGFLTIKFHVQKDTIKLVVPEKSTVEELKIDLYKRWVYQLEDERSGLENQIKTINKQIEDLINKMEKLKKV